MLQPNKVKFKKQQKGGKLKKINYRGGTSLVFGDYGIKALECGKITSKQIESIRVALNRILSKSKNGKLWIRIFPDRIATCKPLGVRMGSGKGEVDHYFCKISAGTILFECSYIPFADFKEAVEVICSKLPMKVKAVFNKEIVV